MPIRAVLFDLDNTLVDFMAMKRAACSAAIDAMLAAGLKAERQQAYDELFGLYRQLGIEHQQIFQPFLEKLTGSVDYAVMAAGIVAYRRAKELHMKPYPDVLPTLHGLKKKGCKIAIVSDAPRLQAWLRLASLGVHGEFDLVVTLDDTGKPKRELEAFNFAISSLGVSAKEVIMVGDSFARDLEPAKRLGIRTALARYGVDSLIPEKQGEADFYLDKISDILKVVESLG